MLTTINDIEIAGEHSINNHDNEYYEMHVVANDLMEDVQDIEEERERRAVIIEAIRTGRITPAVSTYTVEYHDPEEGMVPATCVNSFDKAVAFAADLEEEGAYFVRIRVIRWYTFR